MLASFSDHPTLVGTGREAALADLLRELVPRKYEVLSGAVVREDHGTKGRSQVDIMVVNTWEYPVPLRIGGVVAALPESVYVTIEVATNIDGKVKKKLEQIRQLHRLFREAPPKPALSVLYGYTGAKSIETLRENLASLAAGLPSAPSVDDAWRADDFPDLIVVDTGQPGVGYIGQRTEKKFEFVDTRDYETLTAMLERVLDQLAPRGDERVPEKVSSAWTSMRSIMGPALDFQRSGVSPLHLELPEAAPPEPTSAPTAGGIE